MQKLSRVLAAVLLVQTSTDAFTTHAPQINGGGCRSSSQRFLKPEQADQLVAAFDATYKKYDDNHDSDVESAARVKEVEAPPTSDTRLSGPTAAARAFVGKVFKLPSEPHPEEDVVLYPVIGCTFVKDNNTFRPLPKTTNASCRLVDRTEPLYGYFRPPPPKSSDSEPSA